METYDLILGAVALAGLVSGLVWLAARTAVTAGVERAVERKFREWEVRFSKLHERRVEVVEGVQGHLVDLRAALDSVEFHLVTGGDPEEVERILRTADEEVVKAHRLLSARSFYLPEETCERIEDLLKKMKRASIFAGLEHGVGAEARARLTSAEAEHFGEHFRTLRDEFPGLIDEVNKEFRRLVEG